MLKGNVFDRKVIIRNRLAHDVEYYANRLLKNIEEEKIERKITKLFKVTREDVESWQKEKKFADGETYHN